MRRLRDREWEPVYSTDKGDLVESFYLPCLERASAYWRAVGYFSSKVLALISPAIEQFYARDGKMRIVASPALSEEDRATLRAAYRQEPRAEELQEDETVINCLRRYLDPARLETDEERLRLRLLAGMIRDELLDVRIAVRRHLDGSIDLYHEKIGVFEDASGDYITFNGSPNESWNGWVRNIESFSLHCSWGPESRHAHSERSLFLDTWNRERSGVAVFGLSDTVTSKLFEHFPPTDPGTSNHRRAVSFRLPDPSFSILPDLGLTVPEFLTENGLRPYQKDCIDRWVAAGHRGTFALATGTGKTVVALSAASKFAETHAQGGESTLVVIVVPTIDLAGQWRRNARGFGFQTTVCNSAVIDWQIDLGLALSALQGSTPRVQCVIVTADTMAGTKWASAARTIRSLGGGLLVVGDEMHSLGTDRRLSCLPNRDDAGVGRIGLSATPRRHNDEDGTEALLEYFGGVLASISIADAIALGALCPYWYEPVCVRLRSEEQEEYERLSRAIAKAWQSTGGEIEKLYKIAGASITRRVALLSHAIEKNEKGLEIAVDYSSGGYELLYAGEGVHPLTRTNQVEFMIQALRKSGVRANKFVFDTETDQRDANLRMFRNGDLDVLVAMRCLDEGIDIPEARTGIILASSRNPRQFVQRRGRLLRTAPNKTAATIVDVLCLPMRSQGQRDDVHPAERSLVARGVSRALELAESARNGRVAPPDPLISIMEEYELVHLADDYGEFTTWAQ